MGGRKIAECISGSQVYDDHGDGESHFIVVQARQEFIQHSTYFLYLILYQLRSSRRIRRGGKSV